MQFDQLKRREFITLLGGAAVAWPLVARGQQPTRVPRIGIVDDAPMWHSFRQALHELGYVEGQSVNFEYRYSEGVPDRLAAVVSELVRRPVDLIAAYGTPPTEAAKAATTTIPIVMIGVGDPVRVGLVASLARPGGNITGNTVLSPDLGAKRLQLLREAIPTVARVAYLTNPDNPATLDVLAEMKLAAATAGMTLIGVEFGSASDFDAALAVMRRERTEVLLVSNDPLHQLHLGRIIDFLAKNRIAGMFQSKENVAAGGLIAYGASLPDLFRRAATALTRPNRSAQRLPCGRHAVPTAVTVGTNDVFDCAKREHLRNPSLLMRARAQATVRVWKKRPELQAHSRIGIRGGCGLPVATGAEP